MANTSTALLPYPDDPWVAALTNGTYWDRTQSSIITWGLAAFGTDGWNEPVVQPIIQSALSRFSDVADLQFQYVGYATSPNRSPADMTFLRTTRAEGLGMGGALAWAFFPNEILSDRFADLMTGTPNAYLNAGGDVWLNADQPEIYLDSQSNPGSTLFFVLLHEIGHALGLKHPHDGGSTGRPTFSQLGFADADNQLLTVMSYDEATSVASWYSRFGLPSGVGYPSTLMPMDVVALQSLYGPNTQTRDGPTRYFLRHDGAINTWWDAGGSDVLDAQASNYGWFVLLGLIEHGADHITIATPLDWRGQTETGHFYFNVENVTGSNLRDLLMGDDRANGIEGHGGADILVGEGGNDIVSGSAGDDVVVGGAGADLLLGGIGADILVLAGDDTAEGGAGTDYFGISGAGHFVIKDFDPRQDVLVFDSATTPFLDLVSLRAQTTDRNLTSSGLVMTLADGTSVTFLEFSQGESLFPLFFPNMEDAVVSLIGQMG